MNSQGSYNERKSLGAIVIAMMTLALVLATTACGKSTSGGAPVPPGVPALPPGCLDPSCTSYGNNYIALSPYAQQSLIAYNNQLVGGLYDTSWYFNRSRLTPVNYANLLRDAMGVCDREYMNGGLASCSSWVSGAHIMTLSAPVGAVDGPVVLNMWSVPPQHIYQYSYQAPQWQYLLFGIFGLPMPTNPQGYFNPMNLQATSWSIQNGFEVRAHGPTGSKAMNQLFQLQVVNGKFGDEAFNFDLYLNSVKISTGTMIRCVSQNCQGGY